MPSVRPLANRPLHLYYHALTPTTPHLPHPLFRRIKAKTTLEGTSLKRLITHPIERGLDNGDTTPPVSKPTRSPVPLIRAATRSTTLPLPSSADIHDTLDQQDARHARHH